MEKRIFAFMAILLVSLSLFAQKDEGLIALEAAEGEKKIVADGYGATPEKALNAALQNAIEQAAGAYVSSMTEIENDEIVKEEVLSLSHGFIKEHRKLSESNFGDEYKVVVAAIIVEKQIINSLQASGVKVKYQTSGLVSKLKAWDKMKEDEYKMAKALFDVHQMKNYGIIWDYMLQMEEPIRSGNQYTVRGTVTASTNANYTTEFMNLKGILSELALEKKELKYQLPVSHLVRKGSKQTVPYDRYAFKEFTRKKNGKIKTKTKLIDLVVPIVKAKLSNNRSAYGRRGSVPFKFYGVNEMTGMMFLAFQKFEVPLTTQDKNRINESWLNRYTTVFDFFSKDFTPYVLVLTEGENLLSQSKTVTFYKFMNPKTLDVIREYITFIFEASQCKVEYQTQEGEPIEFIPDAFYAQYAEIKPKLWSTKAKIAYKGYIFNKLPDLQFQFQVEKRFTEEEFNQILEVEVVPFKGDIWKKK